MLGLVGSLPGAALAGLAPDYGVRLEAALNQGDSDALATLVGPQLRDRLQRRYDRFAADFPGATWNVDPLVPFADGRPDSWCR